MDKLNLLRLFIAVVDQGSFAGAAVALGLSPSTVSKAIARLETDLQLFLFHRTTRRLTLTESGQDYAMTVRKLLQDLEGCEAMLTQTNDEPKGRLSINLPVSYGRRYVMPLLAEFYQHYPDIRLEISFDDAYVDMIAQGVDVCIRTGTLEDSQLVARQLSPIDFLICASPEFLARHPTWRNLQSVPLADYALMPWIRFRFRQTGRLMPIMQPGPDGQINLDPGRQFVVDDGEALAELCAQGLGLTQMPHFIARDWLTSSAIIPVAPSYRPAGFGVWVIYAKRAFQPARIKVFVEFLERAMRRQQETPRSTWAQTLFQP
ncbi:MAG: LysR family transcriptional regulator [Hahellaceae bacterium]|nr:LysR family transcriptional regulator [Hahellaceae bacterium]